MGLFSAIKTTFGLEPDYNDVSVLQQKNDAALNFKAIELSTVRQAVVTGAALILRHAKLCKEQGDIENAQRAIFVCFAALAKRDLTDSMTPAIIHAAIESSFEAGGLAEELKSAGEELKRSNQPLLMAMGLVISKRLSEMAA